MIITSEGRDISNEKPFTSELKGTDIGNNAMRMNR